MGNTTADFCRLSRAENLVLSYSSFADAAAMLGHRLRRLYLRAFSGTHSLLDCDLWEGATAYRYLVPVDDSNYSILGYKRSREDVIRWFKEWKATNVTLLRHCTDAPISDD